MPAADEVKAALLVRRERLLKALRRRASDARRRLEHLAAHRVFRRPFERVLNQARELDLLATRIGRAMQQRMAGAKQLLAAIAAQLESLSPLAILGRGYSLTTRATDGRLIDDASTLRPGDEIRTRFAQGQAISEVKRLE